jgi:signal transduction histidine kinase
MFEKLRTIRGKQSALAVAVSVLPLIVIGFLIDWLSIEHIRSKVKSELTQVINDKALSIAQWIEERRSDIGILASTNYIISLFTRDNAETDSDELRDFFKVFTARYEVYRSIKVLNTGGDVLFSYPETENEDRILNSAPVAGDGQVVMSDAFLYQNSASFFIVASVRERSTKVGEVVAIADLDNVKNITDNIRIGDTGEAYLVNSVGFFVTHKDQRRILQENVGEVGPIAHVLAGNESSFVGEFIDYRGIRVLGAYYHLPELAWGLVVEQDVEEAFAPARQLNIAILVIIAVSSLVVAGIAYKLTSLNLQPLSTWKKAIERILNGDLSVRLPTQRPDEIGIVGEAFNKMLEQLQAAQRTLEKRVEAANHDLMVAHKELQIRHLALRRAQARLLQSERLSIMGEVAAGLAHEINNPITTINMLLNSLGGGEEEDEEERTNALRIITEEIEKITAMIGRFMDLTHPQEMRKEVVVIDKVIDKSLALIRPKLDDAGIEVKINIRQDIPRVIGDDRQLGQLLLNLILNSIYAMPEGGTIFIDCSTHNAPEEDRRFLRLRVSDDGKGIPKSIIGKIFNPFFTTRAEGTGLGLFIVARIVHSHGGRITVRSTPDHGTTFFIDLPES